MIEKAINEALINFYNHSFTIIDADENIIYWSDRAAEIFDMPPEAVIGKDIKDVFREDNLLILQSLRNNEILTKKEHQATKNIYVDIKAVPVTIDGEVKGAIVSEVDVTEERKQQIEINKLKGQVNVLSDNVKQLNNDSPFKKIIFRSSVMQALKTQIERAAETNAHILITGETGVGKELFAQSIHESSKVSGTFIPINCGAIPAHLFESELFGYERGAFTGANKEGQKGKVGLSENGTLFLDEIGDMPVDMQVKFLRVLQEKKYFRLGGRKEIHANFRLISATNKSISDLLSSDAFRTDLLYRINVINIHIPPLRERPDDIESLFYYYLYRISEKYDTPLRYADHRLLTALRTYHWPGNTRELINVVERLVIFSTGEKLDDHVFSQYLTETGDHHTLSVPGASVHHSLKNYMNEVEGDFIKNALKANEYNIEQTSRVLGISRPTLYAKMRKFEL